jgi:uncharacterized protein (DUF111 family)
MLLGAILDKAIDFSWFETEIMKIDLPENSFTLEKTYVNRSSISSCKLNIILNKHDHHHRGYSTICHIIDNSKIAPPAQALAKNIFYRLAKAEATVHNKTIEEIHFHEVGALDSIIDIVGFSILYTQLNVEKCYVSSIPVGKGSVNCAHGCLPVPSPATLEILKDSKLSIKQNEYIKDECFTPTAAAILSTVIDECCDFPDFKKIISTGYGAGDKIFCTSVTSNLRFILGETE